MGNGRKERRRNDHQRAKQQAPIPAGAMPLAREPGLRPIPVDAPLSHPVAAMLPAAGGAKLYIFGGMSPLEAMAGQVAAGHPTDEEHIEEDARIIARKAQAILEACDELVMERAAAAAEADESDDQGDEDGDSEEDQAEENDSPIVLP